MNIPELLHLYFIMGSQNCPEGKKPETLLQAALEAGITAFQFREKGQGALVGEEKIALGKRLRALCAQYDVPFFVNDEVELVEVLDADGIHVGQEDESVATLREKFPSLLIGLSVSNEKELAESDISVVDYVGAGPVFSTSTKEDAKEAVGLDWIRQLRKKEPALPIVGIGGIDETNAASVVEAGANGVAVISAITTANDLEKTVETLAN